MKSIKHSIKYIFVLATMLIMVTLASAQSIRRSSGQILHNNKSASIKRSNEKISTSSVSSSRHTVHGKARPKNVGKQSKSVDDTLYCTQTCKQHGWFKPMDEVTKEFTSHRSSSFRFTHRYPSGHWGKLEVIDGYGNPTTGSFAPYILDWSSAETDLSANKDWIDKLKTVSSYEFIADPSGINIIQERAYDKDMNLIYTFSHVPTNVPRQYIGTYKDSYGLPAEMRSDSLYTYGTLVRLTEDRWGNDSVIEFIDAKGKRKPNSDSAAMRVIIADKYGRLLKNQSCNEKSELIIDNWGNCGYEEAWQDELVQSVIYMDANWKPMRMPATARNNDLDSKGACKTQYSYDKYNRIVETTYLTADDRPDTNADGVHKIVYGFDNKGNCISLHRYDLKGILCNNSIGMAYAQFKYDDKGNLIESKYFDKNGKPCSTDGYLCRLEKRYDDNNNEIYTAQYIFKEGEEQLTYLYEENKDSRRTLWSDGIVRIDSLNADGHNIKSTWYNLEGQKVNNVDGYAEETNKIIKQNNGRIKISEYYGPDGKPCLYNNYSKMESIEDTVSGKTLIRKYDLNNNMVETYLQRFRNGKLIGQDDVNTFGVPCRAGGSVGVLHYSADVAMTTNSEEFASLVGRDEFGEPDYISTNSLIYYYQKTIPKSQYNAFLDEDNNIITDVASFKDRCPKVISIEVTDSSAYDLGLRDNDVILADGDYVADILKNDVVSSYDNFKTNWSLHSVLSGDNKRDVIVFRVDPKTKVYGLVGIKGLAGTPSQLGYSTHIRYLTKRQLERIESCVNSDDSLGMALVAAKYSAPNVKGDKYIVMAYAEKYRKNLTTPYCKKIADPAVIFAMYIPEYQSGWLMDESVDNIPNLIRTRYPEKNTYPECHYYLSRDGKNITDFSFDERMANVNMFDVSVSDEIYNKFKSMSANLCGKLKETLKDGNKINAQKLVGKWSTEVEADSLPTTITLRLNSDKTVACNIKSKYIAHFYGRRAVFDIDLSIDGKWDKTGKILTLETEGKDGSLECIDYQGDNEEHRQKAMKLVNDLIASGRLPKSEILKEINLPYFYVIKSLDKNRLLLSDGDSKDIVYRKVKSE